MLNNIEQLPWAVRIFYLLMMVAVAVNVCMAVRPQFKPHWRIYFGYTAVVLTFFNTYTGLRLWGVLDRTDYVEAIVWLYPLLALPFIMVPCLFYWEDKFYKRALTEAVNKELIKLDNS